MRRRPWTEAELAVCPFFVEHPAAHRGMWPGLFPRRQPLHLEIGCGKGVSTARMAHENPDINYIAIDEARHVLAVSARNARAEYGEATPDNLRLSEVDALRIYDTFSPADGIERIYISFPNPWDERAKHHKRRLTHPRQLNQYRDFLKPGGEIWFKTDNDALFIATKRYLGACHFEIVTLIDDLHASGFTPNYVSEHEALYAGQGKPIHFLIAKMAPLRGDCEYDINGGTNAMSNFFETNCERLENFTRVSNSVGARADYVQGGGGNTSVKLPGGLMAIKASGYCLKDIKPDSAYAVRDYEALRRFYNEGNPAGFEDVEKAGSDQAKANARAIEGLAALRPSVEAGFHSILDTYVAHSHSVYANLAACSAELQDIARTALADADYSWGWVSYVDPCARLTFSIREELARVEAETGLRMSQIIESETGATVAVLSGPSHAEEVGRMIPTGVVVAARDAETAEKVQDVFVSECFRVYTSPDLVGIELGAALKNVIALCAGVCDGLGLGDNTKALLMTRGLSEMARLGIALGGKKETFAGLAGVGDLIVTCTSMHSRNRRAGILIGQGKNIQEAMREVGAVVEGYYATKSGYLLCQQAGVEMPILRQAYAVLYEGQPVSAVVENLMLRARRREQDDPSWV